MAPATRGTQQFCQLVRTRSRENRRAFQLLHDAESLSQQFSLLRQELDSMIRVMYLLSIDDRRYRSSLVACTLSGQKWHERESRSKLTDRQMVDLAGRLHGWAQYVYAFGCAFIHLTNASSLKPDDRLSSLPSLTEADRLAIVTYLRHYHGGPAADDPSMREIGCLLVGVFDKIAGNLGRYLQLLENDEMLER